MFYGSAAKGLTKGGLWPPFFSIVNPMVVISRQIILNQGC